MEWNITETRNSKAEYVTDVVFQIWRKFKFCSKRGILAAMPPKAARYPSEEKT